MPRSPRSPLPLAGLPATAGVTHFAAPGPYDATVPRALPGKPRTWTCASGVELPLASGPAPAKTRRTAALASAAFFVGMSPPTSGRPPTGATARHR